MLAIVIPYYKLTFFEETLQSLANQTDKRFKVYIGDDASPENPITLLEKYKGQFDFVYQRFEINLGRISLTKQWDRCIALSVSEEWIMILGDDDVLGENVVEEFYINLPEIEQKEINVIRFSTQVIDGEGQIISSVYMHPKLEKATDFIIKKLKKHTRSSLSEFVFNKKQVIKIGFINFPLGWYSDDYAILEFSEFKFIYSINCSKLLIRFSNFSLSGRETNKLQKDYAKFYFFLNIYFYKKKYFENINQLYLKEKLVDSFMNKIEIKHYLILLYYSICRFDLGVYSSVNKCLYNYFERKFNSDK
jgi:glycosyltransferase involved in cell wall biosynthesis